MADTAAVSPRPDVAATPTTNPTTMKTLLTDFPVVTKVNNASGQGLVSGAPIG